MADASATRLDLERRRCAGELDEPAVNQITLTARPRRSPFIRPNVSKCDLGA